VLFRSEEDRAMCRLRCLAAFAVLAAAFALSQNGAAQPPSKDSATIRVMLPAEARLTVDGHQTTSTGTERLLFSPALPPGKKFSYTLRAGWEEDGRPIVRMAVVTVEAGKEVAVDMRHAAKDAASSQVVYVPTPQEVVDKMLDMAKVTKDDVVFDLGCGDSRIVATAAKKFGAKGVGVDIDPARIEDSKATLKKMEVPEGLVEVRQGDALKVKDLSRATVVTLYMLPEFMAQLKPILERDLKPGTRVVAHDYAVPDWEPKEKHRMTTMRIYPHNLFLYVVGEKK